MRRRSEVSGMSVAGLARTLQWALIGGSAIVAGCTFLGTEDPGLSGSALSRDGEMVPAGYGTLRQEQVTLNLRHEDLLIQITPLAPGIIRLTAPDTYARLRELREGQGPGLVRRVGVSDPVLFLVSFFSYEQGTRFEPEDLHLLNRGLRYRPAGIQPVTPGWGVQRLAQEETQMAVYAFPPDLDLDQDLSVEYQDVRRGGWEQILQRIEGERTRVLARSRAEG